MAEWIFSKSWRGLVSILTGLTLFWWLYPCWWLLTGWHEVGITPVARDYVLIGAGLALHTMLYADLVAQRWVLRRRLEAAEFETGRSRAQDQWFAELVALYSSRVRRRVDSTRPRIILVETPELPSMDELGLYVDPARNWCGDEDDLGGTTASGA